jgi:hypothetical protein
MDRLYTVLAVAATFGCLIFRAAYRAVPDSCAYAIAGRDDRMAVIA